MSQIKNTHNTAKKNTNKIFSFIYYLLIFISIYKIITLIWVCDDIYITFRYVDNFLSGNGIVYNAGERVEGYTHFLWFLLLTFFRLFKFDLSTISIVLGIISYITVIFLFFKISQRNSSKNNFFIPFTALALSVNYDFAVWATGGLETMFFTGLIALIFYTYYFSELDEKRKLALSGLLTAFACMTRPDGIVFYAYANMLIIFWKLLKSSDIKLMFSKLLSYNLPFLLILAPYIIWKINYYGDIVPNTYYVKSAGESYLHQGFLYIWMFMNSYKSTLISLISAAVLVKVLTGIKPFRQKIEEILNNRPVYSMFAAFGAAAAYLLVFVAKVGGDFMFARFIIPVLPLLYYSIETGLCYFLYSKRNVLIAAAAAILILIFFEKNFRDDLFTKVENGKTVRINSNETNGITDERNYYYSYWEQFPKSKTLADALITTGKSLNPYFKDLNTTVVIGGARNYIGYYAEFKNIIVDNGLTDKYIAKLPISERGRIGHEKFAPLDYLIQRKAVFGIYDKFRNDLNQKPYAVAYLRIKELGVKIAIEIIYYNREVILELRKRMGDDFIFANMDTYLDEYLKIMPGKSKDEVRNDYKNLKEFYFDFNKDPREDQLEAYFNN